MSSSRIQQKFLLTHLKSFTSVAREDHAVARLSPATDDGFPCRRVCLHQRLTTTPRAGLSFAESGRRMPPDVCLLALFAFHNNAITKGDKG